MKFTMLAALFAGTSAYQCDTDKLLVYMFDKEGCAKADFDAKLTKKYGVIKNREDIKHLYSGKCEYVGSGGGKDMSVKIDCEDDAMHEQVFGDKKECKTPFPGMPNEGKLVFKWRETCMKYPTKVEGKDIWFMMDNGKKSEEEKNVSFLRLPQSENIYPIDL